MSKETKTLFLFGGILLVSILLGWTLYSLFGHQIVKSMYDGRSAGFLNKIIIGRTEHSVEYYFVMADRQFLICIFVMIMMMLTSIVCRLNSRHIFYTLFTCYILYCIIFIIRASFLNNGVRYFTLFDDAMIAMRYAKNLASGHGLIWNPGGPMVEGYTNFLWTIYMAFWHIFPISTAKMALPIQISGLFFLASSLFLVRKIADYISEGNKYVSIGAVLLTASYLPINFWALRGMETSILGCILLLAAWRFFKCLKEETFDPLLFVILGIGMLTRADFVFLYVAITSFVIATEPKNRKKNFLFAVFVFFSIVGGHTLFRWLYYGDILPNTYYLKMAGVSTILRVQRGLWAAAEFIQTISPMLFMLPFILGVLYRKNVKILFLLYIFALQFLYSVYVGGDAWEGWGHLANRYLCIVMPMFFILTSLAINDLIETIKVFKNKSTYHISLLKNLCFANILILIIFQLHGGLRNDDLIFHHLFKFSELHVEDDKDMIRAGLKLKDITISNAKIAIVWAGSIPYFSDRICVDLLGKNDTYISHLPARVTTYKDFYPGHNKYDYAYSIGKLQPDIVAQLWANPEEASPWLNKYYKKVRMNGVGMYFRKDSQNILWDKVDREFAD